MALTKNNLTINFSQGLDLKTDPNQVSPGRFLALQNSVFNKGGLLQKRNGFGALTSLPDATSLYTTTFNGNLLAIGNSIQAYSQGSQSWSNKGYFQSAELSVLPVVRATTNQSQADSKIASNGILCTAYTDNVPDGMGGLTSVYKYMISDSITGQNIVNSTVIPSTGTVDGSPRVFLLGRYFIVAFSTSVTGVHHLQYIAINTATPTTVGSPTDISTAYTPNSRVNFDGVVANNSLYLAWNSNATSIKMTLIDSTLTQHNTVTFATRVATIMSVSADMTGGSPIVYAAFYNSGDSTGYVLAVDQALNTVHAPTQFIAATTLLNITSSAQNGICTVFYEVSDTYSYDSSIHTNFIAKKTVTQAGVVSSQSTVERSLGLASKSFIIDGTIYLMGVYDSLYQPTYFLIDSSGHIVSKLAYGNGSRYLILGLPGPSVTDNVVQVAYLVKDSITPVNKTQGVASASGIYSQLGVNLASFIIGTSNITSAEIGGSLQLSGGQVWQYDGVKPVELGFHVWPDYVEGTTSTTGGTILAQDYFYQVTYEWTDNSGNINRSAPSIPIKVTTTGSTSSNTINVPTLRLTYKIENPVRIVIYRWSTAQQVYYQVTSTAIPLLNDVTTDSVAFVDIQPDSAILGNEILYTTGGVLENIGPPATNAMTLWQSRLVLVDAEDTNLLWLSKQVIENTPVEMSDLLTIYTAPTTGAQGSTGPTKVLAPMDDKLICFKQDAIYYLNGQGPDNTGANSQISDPVFITSTVGGSNTHSVVFIPSGLVFESDKGLWLLGRDLSTQYIGAPVESLISGYTVLAAIGIPGTNQVRFTVNNGFTIMYDYYYQQWGSFVGIPAISSTLYESLHTYINASGQVYQESPGKYLDGSRPVLMSFTTGWMSLAGLQGYERAYYFYMLASYISPHKLSIGVAYDYDPNITQRSIISPDNYSGVYGSDPYYGNNNYGGNPVLEQWRVFLQQQKCQSFQLTISEQFDPQFNTAAGAGLTISGLNLIVGQKKGYAVLRPSRSVG